MISRFCKIKLVIVCGLFFSKISHEKNIFSLKSSLQSISNLLDQFSSKADQSWKFHQSFPPGTDKFLWNTTKSFSSKTHELIWNSSSRTQFPLFTVSIRLVRKNSEIYSQNKNVIRELYTCGQLKIENTYPRASIQLMDGTCMISYWIELNCGLCVFATESFHGCFKTKIDVFPKTLFWWHIKSVIW